MNINQCLLEQRLDLEVLLGSTHTPEESGLRLMGEPGWTVQRAGAVLKISKCAEISVEISPQTGCYADVPIVVNNTTRLRFLRPATSAVTDSSSLIQCSNPSVHYFQVRGSWYFLSPQLNQVPAPSMASSRSISSVSMCLCFALCVHSHY